MAFINRFAAVVPFIAILGAPPAIAQEVTPRWEVIELAQGVDVHAAEIKALLEQVRPKEWTQDGAPDSYVTQHEALMTDIGSVAASAQDMARNPDKLKSVVDTFLWIDRLNSMIGSLEQGVRRYQNAAVAELLVAARDRNITESEKLKGYLRQLVVLRETELEIANSEAQRCREQLARQPAGQE